MAPVNYVTFRHITANCFTQQLPDPGHVASLDVVEQGLEQVFQRFPGSSSRFVGLYGSLQSLNPLQRRPKLLAQKTAWPFSQTVLRNRDLFSSRLAHQLASASRGIQGKALIPGRHTKQDAHREPEHNPVRVGSEEDCIDIGHHRHQRENQKRYA